MKKISSRSTFFYKRIFPITWLSFAILIGVGGIIAIFMNKTPINGEKFMFITIPFLMFIAGYLFFSYLVFCLYDEVYYDDESLLVVNKGNKTRIPFDEIQNIRYDKSRPPRIKVTLYCEDRVLGKILYFAAPVNKDLFTFKRHPDVEEFFEKFNSYKHSS